MERKILSIRCRFKSNDRLKNHIKQRAHSTVCTNNNSRLTDNGYTNNDSHLSIQLLTLFPIPLKPQYISGSSSSPGVFFLPRCFLGAGLILKEPFTLVLPCLTISV